MPIDERTIRKSGFIPIINDVEFPRIQITIEDGAGPTAGLGELVRRVAKTLRDEEKREPKRAALSYARLCGALAEALSAVQRP